MLEGKKATVFLENTLTPSSEYSLQYKDIVSDEAGKLNGKISFKTLGVMSVHDIEYELLGNVLTASTKIKSNTGINQDLILLMTIYDKVTGEIKEANFSKYAAAPAGTDCTVTVDTTGIDLQKSSIEVYVWNNFKNIKSLNKISLYAGGVQE